MSRSRSYCYTLNNPTDDELLQSYSLHHDEGIRYHICGFERGDSGTPHLQGYIYFQEKQSLASCKARAFGRGHYEMARGTPQQAIEYCRKDGDYFEYGDPPTTPAAAGAAEMERWDQARAAAARGDFESIPSDIYIRYRTSLHAIARDHLAATTILDGELEHEWWWGQPGTGKTSRAWQQYPDAYIKDPRERWWDGYAGQSVVIIDDFDIFQKSLSGDMKRWLDRYPFQAPVKGGYLQIRPSKIIVTSNYHWLDIWEDEITRDAIARRVKEVNFNL